MFSMPLRSLSVEKTSPVVMPNSGFMSTSGVRNSFTPVKLILRRWYSLPSSTGSVISAVMPGRFILTMGSRQPRPPRCWISMDSSKVLAWKYPASWYAWRTRSLSSSSLARSKVAGKMLSNRIECGTPMPLEFFMLRITHRLSFASLPVISMWPTFTLGPAFTTNETFSDDGGICSIWGSTVAYCRPRSARYSLRTTAARWILLGSYCDSTLSPTLPIGRWRNLLDLGLHGGVLPAAFGQVFLEDHGGTLDLVGVVLRFHAEPDLAFLEAVEDFGDGDALGARVLNGTDDAALGDHEADDEAEASGFGFQADIVEASGVPEDHEIAAQRLFVVDVARFGNDQGLQDRKS